MERKIKIRLIAATAILILVVAIALTVTLTTTKRNSNDSTSSSFSSSKGNSTTTIGPTNLPSTKSPIFSPIPITSPSIQPSPFDLICQERSGRDQEGPFFSPGAPYVLSNESLASAEESGTRISINITLIRSSSNFESISNNKDNDDETLVSCGMPLGKGYIIDIWHADAYGMYDNVGYNLRGKYETNNDGQVTIQTILPGRYQQHPRPRHIHLKIWKKNNNVNGAVEILTSQLYFGDDDNELAQLEARYNDRVVYFVENDNNVGSINIYV